MNQQPVSTEKVTQPDGKVNIKNSLSKAGESTTGTGRFLGEDLSISSEAAPKKVMAQDLLPPILEKQSAPVKRAQDLPPPIMDKTLNKQNEVKLPPPPVVEKQQGSGEASTGYKAESKWNLLCGRCWIPFMRIPRNYLLRIEKRGAKAPLFLP